MERELRCDSLRPTRAKIMLFPVREKCWMWRNAFVKMWVKIRTHSSFVLVSVSRPESKVGFTRSVRWRSFSDRRPITITGFDDFSDNDRHSTDVDPPLNEAKTSTKTFELLLGYCESQNRVLDALVPKTDKCRKCRKHFFVDTWTTFTGSSNEFAFCLYGCILLNW